MPLLSLRAEGVQVKKNSSPLDKWGEEGKYLLKGIPGPSCEQRKHRSDTCMIAVCLFVSMTIPVPFLHQKLHGKLFQIVKSIPDIYNHCQGEIAHKKIFGLTSRSLCAIIRTRFQCNLYTNVAVLPFF